MRELPDPDLAGTLLGYLALSPLSIAHNLSLLLANLLGR